MEKYNNRKDIKWYVGGHMELGKIISHSMTSAVEIGGKAYAMYLRSRISYAPGRKINEEEIETYRKKADELKMDPLISCMPHGPLCINLASFNAETSEKSYRALKDDIILCDRLFIGTYNFHPGSTCGDWSRKEGLDMIISFINRLDRELPDRKVKLAIETMAGQGHTLGRSLEEIGYIIGNLDVPELTGVCIDTCHSFSAGYDISTFQGMAQFLHDFEEIIGLSHLFGVHLNDSKFPLGSRKDRHEKIGKGHIGIDCFRYIMNDERFSNIPMILETPIEKSSEYEEEIDLLYSLINTKVQDSIKEIAKRLGPVETVGPISEFVDQKFDKPVKKARKTKDGKSINFRKK